jgi:peptidoglycan/LPS O-acetylase OafA/YrhL
MKPAGERLIHLQTLRAVAALMVAIHHGQAEAAALAARLGLSFSPSGLLPWMAGVDIFFVISGFVMVHASQDLFGQPGAARLFLARRVARIVPLYWAATTLFLLAMLAVPGLVNTAGIGVVDIVSSYLFWPHARPDGAIQPVYSLGWTLNYEMFFYVLFALALALPAYRAVGVVTLVLGGLVVAMATPWGQEAPVALRFWGSPIVLEFAFGMVLALARQEGIRFAGSFRVLLVVAAIATLALDGLWRAQTSLDALLYHGLPAAALVAAATLGTQPPDRRVGPQEIWASRLGDASYALYLLHPFVLRAMREVVVRIGALVPPALLPGAALPLLYLALALIAASAVALAAYRLFEVPVTHRARRLLRA